MIGRMIGPIPIRRSVPGLADRRSELEHGVAQRVRDHSNGGIARPGGARDPGDEHLTLFVGAADHRQRADASRQHRQQ